MLFNVTHASARYCCALCIDKTCALKSRSLAYGGLGNDNVLGDAGNDIPIGDDGNDILQGRDGPAR